MQKINKENTLATKLQAAKMPLEYDSSKNPYYWDVVMSLLYCQDGLCAYTEKRLLYWSREEIASLFQCGEYALKDGKKKKVKPCDIYGDLEHFNSALKKRNGWDMGNFFVVWNSVNMSTKKSEEPKFRKVCTQKGWVFEDIMSLLKPDLPHYQWDTYLEYDKDEHIFIPKIDLDDETADKIAGALLVLGINSEQVRNERIEYIEDKLTIIKGGRDTVIKQYLTAFAFCRKILNL